MKEKKKIPNIYCMQSKSPGVFFNDASNFHFGFGGLGLDHKVNKQIWKMILMVLCCVVFRRLGLVQVGWCFFLLKFFCLYFIDKLIQKI